MSDRTAVTYLFDGTFDGLMTAVFEAYARSSRPRTIADVAWYQPTLYSTAIEIVTDEQKASRVIRGIKTKLGNMVYHKIWLVFLSEQPQRGRWIYDYLRMGFDEGYNALRRLADDRVLRVDKWSRLVDRESSQLLQFVRFSQRQGGVYYGAIEPDYDVLTLMMPYFFDRFRTHPFVLHDKRRGLYGVSDAKHWIITQQEELTLPEEDPNERGYQRLWKLFYDTVAIRERINPRLRMQHMPKKYWRYITEMQPTPAHETESLPESAGMVIPVVVPSGFLPEKS